MHRTGLDCHRGGAEDRREAAAGRAGGHFAEGVASERMRIRNSDRVVGSGGVLDRGLGPPSAHAITAAGKRTHGPGGGSRCAARRRQTCGRSADTSHFVGCLEAWEF